MSNKLTHPIFSTFNNGIIDELSTTKQHAMLKRYQNKLDSFITHSLWFSPLIDTTKSLLAFLPGRFSTTNISGEVLYTLLTLLGQYNDKVLGKPVNNPYSIHYYGDNFSEKCNFCLSLKSTKTVTTSTIPSNTVNMNLCTCRNMYMGNHTLNQMNIQSKQPRIVRHINSALHCFSIFESLLEQLSGQAFLSLTSQYHTTLHNQLGERSNYLTLLLLQNTKNSELTRPLTTQPTSTGTNPSKNTQHTSPISQTIVAADYQLRKLPHLFKLYKENDIESPLSIPTSSITPQLINSTQFSELEISQLSPIERTLLDKQINSDDKNIFERYTSPLFQSLLGRFLSTDTLFQYLGQLDVRYMMRMYQFKMSIVAVVESTKFFLRMIMLYLNSGKMIINKSMSEINIEQLQYMNSSELKRYLNDQVVLTDYVKSVQNYQKEKLSTMQSLLKQQQQIDKINSSKKLKQDGNESFAKNHQDDNKSDKQKSPPTDFSPQLPTKPMAPALSSAFSSNLTSAPFRPLKYDLNQKNPIQTSPFATFMNFTSHPTRTPPCELERSNDIIEIAQHIDTADENAKQVSSAAFSAALLNNTPIQYNNTIHKQSMSNPYEKVPDLNIIKSIKKLYFQRHRGVVAHGQHTINLLQTYFQHYYHFQNPKPEQDSQHNLTESELNMVETVSPHHTFIDYILSIYKINPISPHLHVLGQKISTSSIPISTSPSEITLIDPDLDASNNDSDDENLAISPNQQLHLLSTFSQALPSKQPAKHVISEVLYWIRPVVYTVLSTICNQPALLSFFPQFSPQSPLNPALQRFQTTKPASFGSISTILSLFSSLSTNTGQWHDNLFISHDLSQPSIIPTVVSLFVDFAAYYLSPAWDPQSSVTKLTNNQLKEQKELLSLVKDIALKRKRREIEQKLKNNPNTQINDGNPTLAASYTTIAAQAAINKLTDEQLSSQLHPISKILLQHQHIEQTSLLQTQLMTWKQRQGNYWLYIFRPPFLTFVLLKPLIWLADKLQNVPVIGGFLQLIVALLKIFQHHYFYASGS